MSVGTRSSQRLNVLRLPKLPRRPTKVFHMAPRSVLPNPDDDRICHSARHVCRVSSALALPKSALP